MRIILLFILLSASAFAKGQNSQSEKLTSEAKVLFKQGEYAGCILLLDSAVKGSGASNTEIQYYLIKSHFYLADYQRADAEIRKYYSLNPVQDNYYLEITSINTQLADLLPKKIYYDKEWKVCTEDAAAYYRVFTIDPDRSNDEYFRSKGLVRTYYITGEIRSEADEIHIHKVSDAKSYYFGNVKIYYKSGKLQWGAKYSSNGQLTSSVNYYETGQIKETLDCGWANGKIDYFKSKKYYENGSLELDLVFNNRPWSYDIFYKTTDTVFKGLRIYPNGDSFRGIFTKNLKEIQPMNGKMYYADGSIFTGRWLNGKRHGYGYLRTADGVEKGNVWEFDQIKATAITINNPLKYTFYIAFAWYDSERKDWKIKGWYSLDSGKTQIFDFGIDPSRISFHIRLSSGSYSVRYTNGGATTSGFTSTSKIPVETNNGFDRYAGEKAGTEVVFSNLYEPKIDPWSIVWESGYVLLENKGSHQVNIALALYNPSNNDHQLIGWYKLMPGERRNMNFERPLSEENCYLFTEWKEGDNIYSEFFSYNNEKATHKHFKIGEYGQGFNYYSSQSTGKRDKEFYQLTRKYSTGGPLHYIYTNLR